MSQLEKLFELWSDGYHYEIGSDRDGLDMIEIRYYDTDPRKCSSRIAFSIEDAELLKQALTQLLLDKTF